MHLFISPGVIVKGLLGKKAEIKRERAKQYLASKLLKSIEEVIQLLSIMTLKSIGKLLQLLSLKTH